MHEKREEIITQIERLKVVRQSVGFNRKEFSNYMGIPLRTLEEWEAGRRKMPDYVLRLIEYHVRMERFIKDSGLEGGNLF